MGAPDLSRYAADLERARLEEERARAAFEAERDDASLAALCVCEAWLRCAEQLYALVQEQDLRVQKARAAARLERPGKRCPLRAKMVETLGKCRAEGQTLDLALATLALGSDGLRIRALGKESFRVEDEDSIEISVRVWGRKAIEAMWTEAAP